MNPRHLGALGGSAGGQLAAMLGVRGEGPTDRDSRVNVVVSWSGPMNFTEAPSGGNVAPQIRPRGPLAEYLGCLPLVCPDTYIDASPITHADPTDAPMLLANSTNESTALSQAEDMANALEENGVPFELVVIQGSLHSKAYANVEAPGQNGKSVAEVSADFMREWIDGQGRSPTESPTSPRPSPDGPEPRNRLPLLAIIAAIVALAGVAIVLPLLRRRRY